MRAALVVSVAMIGLIGLAAPSQAAPRAPQSVAVSNPGQGFLQVRDGCGPGWHRHHWRDYWGREDKPAREVWREGLDPGA